MKFLNKAASDQFSILNNIPEGVFILRKDLLVLFWNRCLEKWSNIRKDEIEGKSITEYFPSFNKTLYRNRLLQIFKAGPPIIFSSQLHKDLFPCYFPNGDLRIQNIVVTALASKNKNINDAFFTVQDVTDHTCRIKEYNALHKKVVQEIAERNRAKNQLQQANDQLELRIIELTIGLRRANENLREEVHERKKSEEESIEAKEEAERANQAKSKFLSRVSHELRTPLNAIIGFSQVLERNKVEPLSPDQRKDVEEIHSAGKHLLELINEVLELSHIESGQIALSIKPVNICRLMEQVRTLTHSLAEKHGITVIDEMGRNGNLHVLADPFRLEQVFLNLVSNAIKYNWEGGSVTLFCDETSDSYVRISVEDTGLGISKDQQASLFEPFIRLHSHNHQVEGTGIGFAISKKLVEVMNGVIGFTSRQNKGSGSFIKLPICHLPADPQKQEETCNQTSLEEKEDHQNLTLLYIEDNPMNLALVKKFLKQDRPGIKFLSAPDAKRGLKLARDNLPGLILMDVNLPGIDGRKAFEILKHDKETHNIPVIAVSADVMPKDVQKAMEAGFSEFIPKPVDFDQLLETIDKYLYPNHHQ